MRQRRAAAPSAIYHDTIRTICHRSITPPYVRVDADKKQDTDPEHARQEHVNAWHVNTQCGDRVRVEVFTRMSACGAVAVRGLRRRSKYSNLNLDLDLNSPAPPESPPTNAPRKTVQKMKKYLDG